MISCKMRRELAWCASVRLRKQRWRIYTIHRPITFAKKKLLVQFHFNTLKLKSVRLIIERVSLLALLFNFFLSWTKLEIFLSFLFNIFLKNCFFFKKKYIYKKREKKKVELHPCNLLSLSLSSPPENHSPLLSLHSPIPWPPLPSSTQDTSPHLQKTNSSLPQALPCKGGPAGPEPNLKKNMVLILLLF